MSALMDATTVPRPAHPAELEPAPTAFALGRLHAERLIDAHFPVLRRMHSNAQMAAALGARTAAESMASLERNLAHWDRFGFGLWVLRDLATGRVAGTAGLRHRDIEGVAEVELALRAVPGMLGPRPRDGRRPRVRDDRARLAGAALRGRTLGAAIAASQRVLVKAGLVLRAGGGAAGRAAAAVPDGAARAQPGAVDVASTT